MKFMNNKHRKELDMTYLKKIDKLIVEYDVKIYEINRDTINANAILIKDCEKYYIFIDRLLPNNIKLFVVVHEIMHIKTNTFQKDLNYKKYVEIYVNFRSIVYLSNYLEKKQLLNLLIRVLNEDILFNYMKKKIFWGKKI